MDTKGHALQTLGRLGVVAVVRCEQPDRLLSVAEALLAGGIQAIEITLTTPGAFDIITSISKEYKGDSVLVGAGTVLDVPQAQAAIDAGARFVVSPVFDPEVITFCNSNQVVVASGAFTPTEIHNAWRAGADVVKIFPANIGGPAYFKDLAGPLPGIRLMPTGGVDAETAPRFFAAGAFAVGVGSSVVGSTLIRDGKLDEIRSNAIRFMSRVQQAREKVSAAK